MSNNNLAEIIKEHVTVIESMANMNLPEIESLCLAVVNSLNNGGKVVFMGNGGSAADSQHLAAEFVGRFVKERIALPSIALTTDTSILTAIGNDYGYEHIFARQVAALCTGQDVVVGISTSGNSKNVMRAMEEAKKKQAKTVGLLGGDGGHLKTLVDIPIIINSKVTARIQEAHILIGHILCEYCDEHFAPNS
jgi:D-sedoheptulose 7-phosphate isomerase